MFSSHACICYQHLRRGQHPLSCEQFHKTKADYRYWVKKFRHYEKYLMLQIKERGRLGREPAAYFVAFLIYRKRRSSWTED